MPSAAVPAYLGRDFTNASPGLRFGLLLAIWTNRQDQEDEVNKRAQAKSWEGDEVRDLLRRGMDEAIRQLRQRPVRPLPGLWDKNDFAGRAAWSRIKALGKGDQTLMRQLAERQRALAQAVPADGLMRLEALATAPFTTGLGNEHPLENGFAFLNPYGLPYLPGSGVKGVLRQAARELASGDWGDPHGWSVEPRYPLRVNGKPVLDSHKQPVVLSMLDVLFGRETPDGESDHVRGALSFWDVIPQIAGDSLQVEIMTPHQSHYYQERAYAGSLSPHESGQPNPISFLTVPPGSDFTFHVICDRPFLARLAPDLAEGGAWKTLLEAAFSHAFDWLGFGAKTAVGYGAMTRVATGGAPETSAVPHGTPAAGAALPQAGTVEIWSGVTLTLNPGNGDLTASANKQVARIANPTAQRLRQTLPPDKQSRLSSKRELKGLRVAVEKVGNAWKIISLSVE